MSEPIDLNLGSADVRGDRSGNAREEWLAAFNRDAREWIAQVGREASEAAPSAEVGTGADVVEEPDLYSFFASLCAVQSDVRASTRKTHETLGRFDETLGGVRDSLTWLRQDLAHIGMDKELATIDARDFLLPLLDIDERLRRISAAIEKRPPATMFGRNRGWNSYADNAATAFSIIQDQFRKMLDTLRVRRMQVVGSPFDPRTMTAVAIDGSGRFPDGTVVEEVSPGFALLDRTIKLAEVKVAKAAKRADTWNE